MSDDYHEQQLASARKKILERSRWSIPSHMDADNSRDHSKEKHGKARIAQAYRVRGLERYVGRLRGDARDD